MITRNVGFALLPALALIDAKLACVWAANNVLGGPEIPGPTSSLFAAQTEASFAPIRARARSREKPILRVIIGVSPC